MKRLLGLLITLGCLIGMTAGTAMATIDISDQLSIKGQMRVRFWDKTNTDYNDVDSAQQQYWDQRYRLWVNVKPDSNIKAVLRFDFNDARWGDDSYKSSRWNASGEGHDDTIEVGRAYLEIKQPDFKIVAGQNFYKLGNKLSYENTATGITLESTKLPVHVRVGYTLEDELGTRNDDNDDETTYFIEVDSAKLVKGHLFKAFYAFGQSGNTSNPSDADYDLADDDDYEVHLFGLSAKGKLMDKKLSYQAELDFLTGDKDNGQDIFGQQFWAEASYKLTKKATVGGHFVYAKGTDDADEDQFDSIHDARADAWDIQTYGPFKAMYVPMGTADVLDPEGHNTGAIAGAIYGKYRVLPKLEVYGQYLYVTAESDGNHSSRQFENADVLSAAASYFFTKKTQFSVLYAHTTMDVEGSTAHDDAEQVFAAMLRVKF